MKKFMITLVMVSVVLGLFSEENILWCKKLIFNEPTYHIVQKGEFFSRLSKQYYGTANYWRELALINRAPNKDLVFPGEKVIIPSLDAVKKLSKSRSLTAVNEIVKTEHDWIAKNGNVTTTPLASSSGETATVKTKPTAVPEPNLTADKAPTAEPVVVPAEHSVDAAAGNLQNKPDDYKKSSAFPLIITIVAILLIVGAMSLFLYRRKKKYELEKFEAVGEDTDETPVEEEADDDVDRSFVGSFPRRKREEVLVE